MSWQRLRRLGSNSGGSSPLLGGRDKKKEEKENANLTPLERLLQETGKKGTPVQDDGNDKFFGLENFGNTCYANSILQSLYYSEPFREEVISYPCRSPTDTILNGPDGQPRPTVKISPQSLIAQKQQRNPNSPATARTPVKPEDKNSAEYKKKQALLKGPVVPMDYDNSKNYGMSESLFTSLKDIFEGIIANNARMGVIRPTKLVETLKKERMEFNTGQHQDAHEFLNLLLNSVIDTVEADAKSKAGEGANQVVDSSPAEHLAKVNGLTCGKAAGVKPSSQWVHDLFQGTLTSETVCLTCEKVSQRDEPFIDLSVDIEQHSSVTACLRHFSEEEMLSERNKFSCDNCGYTESQKRMKIKRLPRILALHLKRFKAVDDGGWRLQKLFHRVVYPFHLRLFNTTDDAEDPDKIYELYAVVIHIGAGPFQGHYVSVVKTKEAGWVLFDDELVEPVKKEFVQNFFGDRPGQAAAYVLFYQETTLEKIKQEQARDIPPQAQPKTPLSAPVSAGLKSMGLGLSLNPLSPATPKLPILDNSIDEEPAIGEKLAAAKTASPNLTPVGSLPAIPHTPQLDLTHANTISGDAVHPQTNGATHQQQQQTAPTQTANNNFLNRMRRSSKSGKRPNFFGSLDLTRETKRDKNQSKTNEKTKDILNDSMETPTQEKPHPLMNGTTEKVNTSQPAPLADTKDDEPVGALAGSVGKRRFLSIRRKASELRKSGSRGNILASRKEEQVES